MPFSNNDDRVYVWYDATSDQYIMQDENSKLTYMSVDEYNMLMSEDYYNTPNETIYDQLQRESKSANMSQATQATAKKISREYRNIFAIVNDKVLYLAHTESFHAEMIAQHFNISLKESWVIIQGIDRGYIDSNKKIIDVYRGMGNVKPNLDNVATIMFALLHAKLVTNDYVLIFCYGTLGAVSLGRFMSDYELIQRTSQEPF